MATPRLLSTLLPLESVKLGRLTQNTKRPYSNFIDPLEGRPEATECQQAHQIDYHETIKFSNGSKLQARLGDIFSFAFKRLDAGSAVVTAPRAANYDLQNSEAWFTSACKQEATQKFLQKAHFSNKKVYLVVGYRTVSDAKIEGDKAWARSSETDFEVPASFLQAGMVATSVATSSLAPGTGHTWGVKGSQKNSFQASGEQVFAIQYLKVKFKWHSKRVPENATLGSGNRWVAFWDWRGEEDGGNDDGDDLIEAILTDSSDTDDADDESDSSDESDTSEDDSDGVGDGSDANVGPSIRGTKRKNDDAVDDTDISIRQSGSIKVRKIQ